MKDVLDTVAGWIAAGERVALGVLVERRGSAPRDPGAVLALSSGGAIAGSVTGGCVEPALLREAADVLAGGAPRVVTYGIADTDAFDVGLACGGTVALLVTELDPAVVAPLARAFAADEPVAFAVHLTGSELGRQEVLEPGGASTGLAAAAAPLLAAGESALVEHEGELVFVDAFAPRPSLLVLGAIDHAAALTRVGSLLGYRVTVCDARAAFVTPERFPHADELVVDWPDRFLRRAEIDERTAICVLTHDVKFDVPALLAALETPARYIGAMGSRTTTEEREERLRAEGVGDADLARIHAPIGLAIGARSPEEVAVAIGAEIVEAASAARRRLTGSATATVLA